MLVALCALSVGLLTAFISIYSAYIDRAYARASVWPKLEIFRSFSANTFSYGISNKGTGPAIITFVKVTNGEKVIRQWADVDVFSEILQSHIGNVTIPAGQSVNPLQYKGDDVAKILDIDDSISIELCYCSIYRQCWAVDRGNVSHEVDECVIPEDRKFQQ